jgi:hypothetical protein
MLALLAGMPLFIAQCGGGGGSSAPSAQQPSANGMGSVAAAVSFSGRINGRAVAQASTSVTVTITISGYYKEDGSQFPPVSTTVTVDPAAGPVQVQVLQVPIGVNHLLTATADWGGGRVETIKVIIREVEEGRSVTATANALTTVVADTALYYAEQNGLTLDEVDYAEIEKISSAVQALYESGVPYHEMQPGSVLEFAENMDTIAGVSITPAQASVVAGQTYQFTIAVLDANGNPAAGLSPVLSLDPGTIGTISPDGLFTAAQAGSGVLTATYETFSATASITVISTCGADADCDDGDPLTLDACSNPGTAQAACTHTAVACSTDTDCNDNNALTIDSCSNGGTASAACVNTAVACNTDLDCGGSAPVCISGGTASAACVACSTDTDCDDGDPLTLDACSNGGTASASCANSSYACNTAADCSAPAYACINGGSQTSACIGCGTASDCPTETPLCSAGGDPGSFCYACDTEADCDDGDVDTIDTCFDGGTAQAICAHSTTIPSAAITADQTWNRAGSPYLVEGQIQVEEGVTLTIEPGTIIEFACPGAGTDFFMNGYSDFSGIMVLGTLNAIGTQDQPISMGCGAGGQLLPRSAGAAGSGAWGGIMYYGVLADGTLQYVNMDSAAYAIGLSDTINPIPISHINITNAVDTNMGQLSYHIQVKTAKGWTKITEEHYKLRFDRKLVDVSRYLPDADGEYKVRITQTGGNAAQIDAVELMSGGRALPPAAFTDMSGAPAYLYKVSRADNDVIDAHGRTFEIAFNPPRNTAGPLEIALTAREESEDALRFARPFHFPDNGLRLDPSSKRVNTYTLGANPGALAVDGELTAADALPAPLFIQGVRPDTGHPDAPVYGYMKNDSRYLYAALDFVSDNTFDGDADYAALLVRVNGEFKRFRVSVPETTYGSVGFTYTDKAGYQHKVYEFKIPLEEIGSPAPGEAVDTVFEAYGTSAMFQGAVVAYYASFVDISFVNISINPSSYTYAMKLHYLNGTGPHSVNNISVTDGNYAISLYDVTDLTMSNIQVTGIVDYGALELDSVYNSTLSDISLTNNYDGLYMSYCENVDITNLTAQASDDSGLYIADSSFITCDYCTASSMNYSNAYIEYSSDITITNSIFNGNDMGYTSGLEIDSSTVSVSGTDMSYNPDYGLKVMYDSEVTMTGCRISNNCNGVYAYFVSYPFTLNGSNIVDNVYSGVSEDMSSVTELNGVYLAGNAGAAPGEADLSTTVPYSESTPQQYLGVASVSNPQASPIAGLPENAGTPPGCY